MRTPSYSRLFGLIGYPLGHSFSERYFNSLFRRDGIDSMYLNFPLRNLSELPALTEQYPELCGFNVTIPYKERILPMLDAVDPLAASIGAVNVVTVERRHRGKPFLTGYNTDVTGFTQSIAPLLPSGAERALVLGNGGAAKAVIYGLKGLGIQPTIVSRTPSPGMLSYRNLDSCIIGSYKVIVNTTPLGMYPNTDAYPSIPYESLTQDHLCFDLIYNPEETLFMKKARENGARVKNGMEMLILQAEGARRIWENVGK